MRDRRPLRRVAPGAPGILCALACALLVAGCAMLLGRPRWLGSLHGRAAAITLGALVVIIAVATTAAIAAAPQEHGHAAADAASVPHLDAAGSIRADLGDGRTLQVLLATTAAGATQLHLTYFAADGTELAVPEVEVHAIGPDGTAAEVTTTKYTQGHYLASATLPAGEWTFEVHGTTADGQDVTTSFAATVG